MEPSMVGYDYFRALGGGGNRSKKSPTNLKPAWPMQWVPGLLGCPEDFVSENSADSWDGSADNSACQVSLRAWGQSQHPMRKEKTYSRKLFFDLYRHIMMHEHPHRQKPTRNLKITTIGNFFLYSTTISMIYVSHHTCICHCNLNSRWFTSFLVSFHQNVNSFWQKR